MCGSRASTGYGSGGRVNGPLGAALAPPAGCAPARRMEETLAQAAVASAVVFRAWRRVIIIFSFLLEQQFCSAMWLSAPWPRFASSWIARQHRLREAGAQADTRS